MAHTVVSMFQIYWLFLLMPWACLLVDSRSVLMIGDSIDRGIGEGWCDYHNLTANMMVRGWGNLSIQYGGNWGVLHSPSHCVNLDTNDSISTLHIYGASANGPYSPNYWQKTPGTINESLRRILIGITQYIETFGKPDMLMFQSNTWDVQDIAEHRNPPAKEFLLKKYRSDINQRLNQIRTILKDQQSLHTVIAVRTTT